MYTCGTSSPLFLFCCINTWNSINCVKHLNWISIFLGKREIVDVKQQTEPTYCHGNDMKEKTPCTDFWLFTKTEKRRKRLTNQEPLSKSSEVCRKLLLKCSQWGLNPHGGLNKSVLQLEHNSGARWNQNTRPKQHYGEDLSRERTFVKILWF